MSLAASIADRCTEAETLAAISGRLYPGQAPASPVVPYMVQQTISAPGDRTLGEQSASGRHLIQFSIVAATYKEALDLGNALIALLDDATLAAGEVCLGCNSQDGFSESTDQFLRIVEADFFVPNPS